jgi:hypothetical protein
MLGMQQPQFDSFLRALRLCSHPAARELASSSVKYARERYNASSVASQAKKYVNVAGGGLGAPELRAMLDALGGSGSVRPFASVVPGPLIRATADHTLTHMPLQPGSTHVPMKKILDASCVEANRLSFDPDLDLGERKSADFNNHSLRRLADSTARRYMRNRDHGRDEVLPWEIDL